MALLALGRVQVSVLTFPSMRSTRTWPLIRRTDPELWQLVLVTGGRMGIEQHRSQAVVSAGDLLDGLRQPMSYQELRLIQDADPTVIRP